MKSVSQLSFEGLGNSVFAEGEKVVGRAGTDVNLGTLFGPKERLYVSPCEIICD